MAESPLKRQREETRIDETDETKRHKSSYNDLLSLLDETEEEEEEEEEPAQDLSSLITSLQHELSSSYSSDSNNFDFDSIPFPNTDNDQETSNPITSSSCSSKEDEVDDKERVMRRLLEASDDELGIPSMETGVNNSTDYDEVGINCVDSLSLCDGLWDLEDEAANYYTLLQSELFM